MKKINESWLDEFNFENSNKNSKLESIEEIPNDFCEALKKFHQKEHKRTKTFKKKKLAWQ